MQRFFSAVIGAFILLFTGLCLLLPVAFWGGVAYLVYLLILHFSK